jgi:tetratricopeptide (TPR) repeat protein
LSEARFRGCVRADGTLHGVRRWLLALSLLAALAGSAGAQGVEAPVAAADDARDEAAFAEATRKLGEGDLAGARAALEALATSGPDGRWADDALGEAAAIAERQGDLAGARALWKRLLDGYPDSRLARRATARLAELTTAGGAGGQWDATAAEHDRIVRAAAAAEDPQPHLEALAALLEKSRGYPRWFAAALWLGDGWARLGAHRRALAWYDQAEAAATTELERFRAGLARAALWTASGEHDRAERQLRALQPPDDLARLAIADALADVDTSRTRARWADRARMALGACAILALFTLWRRAGSARGAVRALWPPPLEVLYLAPVALVLGLVAETGNLLAALVITWLSGTGLELARGNGPLRAGVIVLHAAVAALATIALVYSAVMSEQLLDVLVETWRRGHDMR